MYNRGLLRVARRMKRAIGLCSLMFLLMSASSRAQVNSWIKPTSGDWQEQTSWSLRILPDSLQSVSITNACEKTVTINTATAQNFPQSLAVNSLLLTATNVLLLNNVGTDVPLTVTNGLRIAGASSNNPATLINLQSGLIIENGSLDILNGRIIQNGGFIKATNGTTFFSGYYYLTNGLFEAGTVRFGFNPTGFSNQIGLFDQYGGIANLANLLLGSVSHGSTYTIYGGELNVSGRLAVGDQIEDSHFHQYGGRVTADSLGVGSHFGGNDYTLHDGELVVTGRLGIGSDWGPDIFLQEGGTNCTSELEISGVAGNPKYTLKGGLLCSGNVVLAVGYQEPVFEHNGGIHIVTNTLSLIGYADRYGTDSAYYLLTDGFLSAGRIEIQASIFRQTNSTTLISGTFQLGS